MLLFNVRSVHLTLYFACTILELLYISESVALKSCINIAMGLSVKSIIILIYLCLIYKYPNYVWVFMFGYLFHHYKITSLTGRRMTLIKSSFPKGDNRPLHAYTTKKETVYHIITSFFFIFFCLFFFSCIFCYDCNDRENNFSGVCFRNSGWDIRYTNIC